MQVDEIVRKVAEECGFTIFDDERSMHQSPAYKCFYCNEPVRINYKTIVYDECDHAPGCVWVAARKWVEEREK